MTDLIIAATFGLNRRRLVALRYALRLAERLQAPPVILIGDDEDRRNVERALVAHGFDLDAREAAVMRRSDLAKASGRREIVFVSGAETLREAREDAPLDSHILLAIEEDGARPSADERLRICLPFGNREAAAHAAVFAIPLAARLGATVIACHTTYGQRQGSVGEGELTPDSRVMLNRIKRLAEAYGVKLIVHLEAEATSIHAFANAVANTYGCFLTVVAPGAALRNGSADLIAETSNLPVLTASTARTTALIAAFLALDSNSSANDQQASSGHANQAVTAWYLNPVTVELIAAAHYIVKAVVGLAIGQYTHSLVIVSDAMHKASDALQGILVAASMRFADRARRGFHFQMRSLETGMMLFLGGLVLSTATLLTGKALVGLLAQWPSLDRVLRSVIWLPTYTPSHTEPGMFLGSASFMAISILLSLIVSRYQMFVGKRSKEALLVADGEETKADSITELGALLGIIGAQGFGWQWADGVSALLVSVFVFHAGWEIFCKGLDSFNGKSLGEDVEERIARIARTVAGVEGVERVVTNTHGISLARCSITLTTRLTTTRHAGLSARLKREIEAELLGLEGIKSAHLDLVIREPQDPPTRFALACRHDATTKRYHVVATPAEVTHVLICDETAADTARSEITPHVLTGDLWTFAQRKRIQSMRFHTATGALPQAPEDAVPVGWAHSHRAEDCLGIPL